jgi:hypothetical protein
MPGRRSRAATSTEAFASDSESLHRSAAEDLRRLVGHLPHRSRATSVSPEDYSLKEPHEQDYREHRRYVVPCCPNLRIAAQQTPEWGSGVAPFAFALTGDMPYGPVRETPFARLVAEINRDNAVDFVMHAGDMLRLGSAPALRLERPASRRQPGRGRRCGSSSCAHFATNAFEAALAGGAEQIAAARLDVIESSRDSAIGMMRTRRRLRMRARTPSTKARSWQTSSCL